MDMRQLFQNLADFWLEYADAIPSVTFDAVRDAHTGRFVRFVQALGCELAADLEADGTQLELAANLRDLTTNSRRVRTWLEAIGLHRIRKWKGPRKD